MKFSPTFNYKPKNAFRLLGTTELNLAILGADYGIFGGFISGVELIKTADYR
jgi:hypothetical protein